MNTAPHGPDPTDLAALLPAPGTPELSAERHRVLKEAFLAQLVPETAHRPRRPWLVPLAAAGLTVVLAVALITALRPTPPAPAAAGLVTVLAGDPSGAAPLLARAADAVVARPGPPELRAGQFAYVRSRVAWREPPGSSTGRRADVPLLDTVHDRELWTPQSGGTGLIRENGVDIPDPGAEPNRRLTALPTDPAVLLRKIYADTEDTGRTPDAAAFFFVDSALATAVLPPAVTAALYRAAARIPGLELIPASVDATGRPGVAVGRTDDHGERHEWIFDPATFAYLGSRSYLVRTTSTGPAGTLTSISALMERAVVGRAGETP